jgi:hypothetical protein
MYSLHELQRRVLSAIRSVELRENCDWLGATGGGGPSPEHRVAIYRNNWREGFRKALALAFPVIERLVGAACFRALAADFQDREPSRSGNLSRIAPSFPGFLAARFAGAQFAYMGDVARLELLCQQVQLTGALAAADPSVFAGRPTQDCSRLRFRLQPNARLLDSPYPISRIWRANQGREEPELIDVSSGPERLLVLGSRVGVELHRLSRSEFALLDALAHGCTLGEALEAAANLVADFAPADALGRLFKTGALCCPDAP